jgi:glycosyltransferase involved in cell wall biosynthesis
LGTLSVCMIVRDEEKIIASTIKNLWQIADEIILVDTGSIDNTRQMAERLGCRVFYYAWDFNFSNARNESLKHAKGDYILWFDADDYINEQTVFKILQLKKEIKNHYYVFTLENTNWIPDTLNLIGYVNTPQIRMFKRNKNILFNGRLHEQLNFKNTMLQRKELLSIVIYHQGYQNQEVLLKKIRRNNFLLLLEFGFNKDKIVQLEYQKYFIYSYENLIIVFDKNKCIGLSQCSCDFDFYTKIDKIIEKYEDKNNDSFYKLNEEIERIIKGQKCQLPI